MDQILKRGTLVTWESQAGGYTKRKVGTILAFIPKNEDGYQELFKIFFPEFRLPPSQIKGQRYSQSARYLVEVPRGGKSKLSDYYTPYDSRVEAIQQ